MAKDAHSAVPSWSGFLYQGKLAIYYALTVIQEKLSNNSQFNFRTFQLEIEWQEDFAIMINSEYESIHQVKAITNSIPSEYKKAIIDIANKISKGIGKIGYLHLLNEIEWNNTEYSDFLSFKRSVLTNYDLSVADKITIYSYLGKEIYYALDQIDQIILKIIENIYSHKTFEVVSLTNKQYEAVKYMLFELLDSHITEAHTNWTNNKNNIKRTILFDDLLSNFNKNHEEYSLEYCFIKVKNKFCTILDDYCNDRENCANVVCDENCHLYIVKNNIKLKKSNEIYNVIKQSTPHYSGEFEDLLQENGLNGLNGLSQIFHKLDTKHQISKDEYLYKANSSSNSFLYLPTTISGGKVSSIAKRILENNDLDSIIDQYEIDIFISDNITSNSIEESARNLKNCSFDTKDYDIAPRLVAINKIKRIKIQPIQNVIDEGDF
ncbi:MAG: hypothetical protein K2P99_07380 [Burkholderiales bacterium]|nr:hypothetical protein [Burkholderiales bacterium]